LTKIQDDFLPPEIPDERIIAFMEVNALIYNEETTLSDPADEDHRRRLLI
jgi:hypothetical protein